MNEFEFPSDQELQKMYHRFYRIAGITLMVASEESFSRNTYEKKFSLFEVNDPGDDSIKISHHFHLPEIPEEIMYDLVYKKEPWAVYRQEKGWLYLCYTEEEYGEEISQIAYFSTDYSRARLFYRSPSYFHRGGLDSLSLSSTDQVILAQLLAPRKGIYLHSGGVDMDGSGLLFVGRSGAGKSTTVEMMRPYSQILCDDRMIIRLWPEGFRIHGTWNHGDIPEVSPNSVPLKGMFFIEQSPDNRIIPFTSRKEVVHRLLSCLIRPLVTGEWLGSVLETINEIVDKVPCFRLQLDKSGAVIPLLKEYCVDPKKYT